MTIVRRSSRGVFVRPTFFCTLRGGQPGPGIARQVISACAQKREGGSAKGDPVRSRIVAGAAASWAPFPPQPEDSRIRHLAKHSHVYDGG